MIFLELTVPGNVELGEFILNEFKKNKAPLTKSELHHLVRTHALYFMNKPIGFLPFKVFKKGKTQLYLNLPGFEITAESILYEDNWLVVINKPSGLASQASLNFLQDHSFSAVMCYLRNKNPFKSPQLFLLHRLDMDTSGVLLMSKKSSINKGIQNLFEKKEIKKTYLAVTKNNAPSLPEKIISYLARKPDKQHKFKFGSFPKEHPGARYSETHFKVLNETNDLRLYQVSPQTGRSHQIRVHMAEKNQPILGDFFYGTPNNHKLHLHAKSLEFIHPETKELINIEAPLPNHWTAI